MDQHSHIHFIGIGGTGLSAIARILLERDFTVSGSDMVASPLSDEIAQAGARVTIGHAAENISGADLVIQSSAIPPVNPELVAAHARGIPVYKRSEFLGQLMKGYACWGVAGTHGKTTTTSMLAWVLTALGEDPSFIIGGVSKNLRTNAHHGSGKTFVIEADEYDRMFHGLDPQVAIVTNMQHDHPDCFPTPAEYRQAFIEFLQRVQPDGRILLCADEPNAHSLAADAPQRRGVFTYGFSSEADYRIDHLHPESGGCFAFDLLYQDELLQNVRLQVPGEHNAQNACAVLAAIHQTGRSLAQAAEALYQFCGSERRFDIRGTVNDITLVDDYAHHPTEIAATLHAARMRFPRRRIISVWQPHTYSRTIALMDDFAHCFSDADCVLVTEVYAAREKNDTFSAQMVADLIDNDCVHFTNTLAETEAYLLETSAPGDVIIVCSAGTAIEVTEKLYAALQPLEDSNA
ncbi:MAG: UDP-N-acetylmuramate--L-alanine ligase [Anaerolineae bacterium]|nr:UDP-N-acetylmuramate--L-alanine ligase [Anaerolineae bacterium]